MEKEKRTRGAARAKAAAEESEKKRVSKLITRLLEDAYSTGTLRPYEDVESDFNRELDCCVTFSQNK